MALLPKDVLLDIIAFKDAQMDGGQATSVDDIKSAL